jgi:hypothetical protein
MTDRKSTVFVTQIPSRREHESGVYIPTIDVTPARQFGELLVILPMGMNYPTADAFMVPLRTALWRFDPRRDHLLPLGDPLVQAQTVATLATFCVAEGAPSFSLLKWDRNFSCYHAYQVIVRAE